MYGSRNISNDRGGAYGRLMFILTILIHELGHLLFGLVTGYRFLHIEILGFSVEHIGGALRIRKYKNTAVGQCMMYSEDEKKNPLLLVCGGLIFNLAFGIAAFAMAAAVNGLIVRLILLVLGSINLSVALTNMFLGSETSDGKVFGELAFGKRKPERRILYNRILRIAVYLRKGSSYRDMPGNLFSESFIPKDALMSTEKEMKMHIYRYKFENGEENWDGNLAGEPVVELVENALKKDGKSGKAREQVFRDIIGQSAGEMFAGEFLCAARCYCMIKSKENDAEVNSGAAG